jgi:ABC-type antimicrobial peptide transport system permease subunit
MLVMMCVVGAALGLTIGMLTCWLVLSLLGQREAQVRASTIRLPAPLNDVPRARELIIYMIPLAFASVGIVVAYSLCMAHMH